MKTGTTRTFLREFLEQHGAVTSEPGPHRLRVESGPELTKMLGRKEMSLAFNVRGVRDDPESELATVGNPIFDRILELATELGRVGVRYERSQQGGKNGTGTSAEPTDHLELGEGWVGFGPSYQTYVPLYCHVFRVESSIDDTPDVLEVVCVDGTQLTSLPQTPDLAERWAEFETSPEPEFSLPNPLPVPEFILRRAIEAMAKRLRKRTSRLRRTAEGRLARETESIGEYYQSLVAETRSASRRWTGGPAAREEKIRILQLDWKRRMEEARTFWMPRIDVSLVGVGVVQQPRTAYPLTSSQARATADGTQAPAVFYDPAAGRFSIPAGVENVTHRAE